MVAALLVNLASVCQDLLVMHVEIILFHLEEMGHVKTVLDVQLVWPLAEYVQLVMQVLD